MSDDKNIIDSKDESLTPEEQADLEAIAEEASDPTLIRFDLNMLDSDLRKIGPPQLQMLAQVVVGWAQEFDVGMANINLLMPTSKILTGKPRIKFTVTPISIAINKEVQNESTGEEEPDTGGSEEKPTEPSA